MCCTGAAPVRSQIACNASFRSFLVIAAARTLISSCAASARSISASTPSCRPASPIRTTGSSAWARAFSDLHAAGLSVFMDRGYQVMLAPARVDLDQAPAGSGTGRWREYVEREQR
jgi:hypothetical protein